MEQSLVLFSGGIDSTTALYWSLKEGKEITALTFDYRQRHKVEIRLAKKLTERLKIPHTILHVDLSQIGGSSLTDSSLPLPQLEQIEEIKKGLPSTYVPFRNGIFLALAAAWAEVNNIKKIVCGFNVIDSPHYPDTRKQFVEAMEEAINSGTGAVFGKERLRILAPFLAMRKSEIIKYGLSLGADYSYSISCYQGSEIPCLKCSSCLLRQKAWEEAGLKDPLISRLEKEGKL
ncbi:MAG: 7-cyano-7-deazaguanine synthase QueC [Candidatus Aminicenantes bacterium]|nr:7-cyano-7-deazaguanine synthase QueC [Candidatus Aminicenantes bacterium]MDH5383869.1 7-cyano-7-deazaguanine synthase QueC [Candidatus Aminicenantes bacterium]MDH5742339.1 7-cyano-7-deazaguanine synthase QueC [Candidatus Aminicenantes bacterium]